MDGQWTFGKNKIIQLLMALTVGIIAIAASTFGILFSSNYSPILFLGGTAAAIVLFLCIRNPVLILYVTLFVVLLPIGLLPDEVHSQINRILTIAAFSVWFLSFLINRQRIFWTISLSFMLAFLAWSLLTLTIADNVEWAKVLLQVYTLRFILFIFLIPNLIRTIKNLNGMLITLALNGWVLLVFTVYEFIQNGYTYGSRFRLLSSNENAVTLMSIVTLLGVLWVTTQLSGRKQVIKNLMATIFILFLTVSVVASGSRGSAISLLITIVAFFFWRETRPWALLLTIIVLFSAVFLPSLFITTIERFLVQTSDSQSLLGGREVLWSAAWRLINEHPLIGVGIGNARLSILPYLNIAITGVDISVHNPILVIWIETGLLGVLLYIGVLVSAIFSFINQFVYYRNLKIDHPILTYFAFVSSIFLGYAFSWIKGGGGEMAFSYFFMLALLLIPSGLNHYPVSIQDSAK